MFEFNIPLLASLYSSFTRNASKLSGQVSESQVSNKYHVNIQGKVSRGSLAGCFFLFEEPSVKDSDCEEDINYRLCT